MGTSSLTHQTPALKPDIHIKALPSSFLNFKDQICCETLLTLILPISNIYLKIVWESGGRFWNVMM